jgi:hypothetical protein
MVSFEDQLDLRKNKIKLIVKIIFEMQNKMMNLENTFLIVARLFAYTSLFILLLNIVFYDVSRKKHTHCVEGNCKKKCFGNSEHCYWHNPVRKALSPIGSEVTPRRSLRIALKENGYSANFPNEYKLE